MKEQSEETIKSLKYSIDDNKNDYVKNLQIWKEKNDYLRKDYERAKTIFKSKEVSLLNKLD